MRLTWKNLSSLWLPGVVLAAAVAAGALIVRYANADLARAQQRLAAQTAALDEARRRFQRSDEEKAAILRYLPAYQALQQEGFVGGERRIEWIEGLRAADRKAGLDGVQFRIDPQEPFQHPAAAGVIAQRLRRSTMKLTLGLTHELDLLEFLDALRAQSAGLFSVRACAMTGQPGDPAPRRANLQAECEIDWLTVAAAEPSA
ncbi:MAG TPA: hypothetical protein VNM24_08270 [Burkholderiales bacterium]|jgi:hypothetical protein|nr:hypothetical protein [Burkholderiales bacterium]